MNLPAPRAKKSLGQHFLKDTHLAKRIVDMLAVQSSDHILEIGPGPGALTSFLLQSAPKTLLLVEKDRHWASHHANEHSNTFEQQAGKSNTDMRVVEGDAVRFAWEDLQGPWKIISNLPYNVGSVILWDMVHRVSELVCGVFMVQKEVAERLAAKPGGKDYGGLSVWIQSYVRVEWGFVVPPGAFAPPPKVDSAIVKMTPLTQDTKPQTPDVLSRLIKLCFQQRRKQMQSILKKNKLSELIAVMEQLGLDPMCRPETLSPSQFQALALAMAKMQDNAKQHILS